MKMKSANAILVHPTRLLRTGRVCTAGPDAVSSESVYCVARQRSISFSSDDKASPASRPILCDAELTHLCCCCDLMPFASQSKLVDIYRQYYRPRCLTCGPQGNRRSSSFAACQLALSNARCSMAAVWSLALLVATHMYCSISRSQMDPGSKGGLVAGSQIGTIIRRTHLTVRDAL